MNFAYKKDLLFSLPSIEVKPKPTVGIIGGCPDSSWYAFGSYCYYFAVDRYNNEKMMKTWGNARIDCQQRHSSSDLASILGQ